MELNELKALLDAKIDPITKTIEKLEKQQERIVEIVSNQAVMMSTVKHIEDTINKKIEEADQVHNELFDRLRKQEERISSCREISGNRIWDIVKLLLAAILGAVLTKIGWK